ncbi:unnamed protein product [Prunus armeniaca]|uniref:Uncharacterized protein n=1 Tax=Prunus armeniaca TaxID=36596 RepID=A0A6J5VLE1_PRUAR|nr:unnamed protein product [Prunus armeniaca]CAB4319906.1 unnamed protein product [Prunus armeniaca]
MRTEGLGGMIISQPSLLRRSSKPYGVLWLTGTPSLLKRARQEVPRPRARSLCHDPQLPFNVGHQRHSLRRRHSPGLHTRWLHRH